MAEHPTAMKLTIRSLDYLRFAGLAVAVLIVERTTELMWLHHSIMMRLHRFR